jgi:uncharacterized protein (TIGR02246 family)
MDKPQAPDKVALKESVPIQSLSEVSPGGSGTSETARLADQLIAAWERFDVDAFMEMLTPQATLEVRGQFTAVGAAEIRRETIAYFSEPLRMSFVRRATSLHPDAATLTLGITLSRPNGSSVGPLAATVRFRRDGSRLSYLEISDFVDADASD